MDGRRRDAARDPGMSGSRDLGPAAEALLIWALYSGRFDVDRSRLSADAPFPSSVYTGVSAPDRPGSVSARQLIIDLTELAENWERWEATHPEPVP